MGAGRSEWTTARSGDPAGHRLEAFFGPEVAGEPFRPGRAISGVRTGALGMGHAVITLERIEDALAFYRGFLGFGLSDNVLTPLKAFFLHVNARHHSLALNSLALNSLALNSLALNSLALIEAPQIPLVGPNDPRRLKVPCADAASRP